MALTSQKISDLIEPETYIGAFNRAMDIPENQFTTPVERVWKLIKNNRYKLAIGVLVVGALGVDDYE